MRVIRDDGGRAVGLTCPRGQRRIVCDYPPHDNDATTVNAVARCTVPLPSGRPYREVSA